MDERLVYDEERQEHASAGQRHRAEVRRRKQAGKNNQNKERYDVFAAAGQQRPDNAFERSAPKFPSDFQGIARCSVEPFAVAGSARRSTPSSQL